jgi:hypothetical protein
MSVLLPTARSYWDAGLCPMPRAIGEVKPSYRDQYGALQTIPWGQYKTQQPDWPTVEAWFRHSDLTTTGMLLLAGSHAHPRAHDVAWLQILDIESAEAYEALHEELTFTGHADILHRCVRERTPSGGAHLGFLCPAISEKPKLKLAIRAADTKILIELLQHQPCTVAPTAMRCKPEHPDGGCYHLVHGSWAHPYTLSNAQRQALIDAARLFNEVPEKEPHDRSEVFTGATRPGDRLNVEADITWWQDLLTKHGWRDVSRPGLRSKGISSFQRPGKTGFQASATYGKTGIYLYVFSSNAHPFEPDTPYTPFKALALLEYNGDFGATTKALAQHYGMVYTPEERHAWRAQQAVQDITQPPVPITGYAATAVPITARPTGPVPLTGRPTIPTPLTGWQVAKPLTLGDQHASSRP